MSFISLLFVIICLLEVTVEDFSPMMLVWYVITKLLNSPCKTVHTASTVYAILMSVTCKNIEIPVIWRPSRNSYKYRVKHIDVL